MLSNYAINFASFITTLRGLVYYNFLISKVKLPSILKYATLQSKMVKDVLDKNNWIPSEQLGKQRQLFYI